MHTPYSDTRKSKLMELPNGTKRIVQYNPNTLSAGWNVIRDNQLVRIPGIYFRQSGRHYFIPRLKGDREWIMNNYEAKRDRADDPTTKAAYVVHAERLASKYSTARKTHEKNAGTYFVYKGVERRMYYTRMNEPYGYMNVKGERVYGYIYNGKFVALKKDMRWNRNLSA